MEIWWLGPGKEVVRRWDLGKFSFSFVWIKKNVKITFIYFLVHTHTCQGVHVEARGPLGGVGSVLPPCGATEPRLFFHS